jgi:predicted nucleic-acid-binding Zn-ribbon protein
MASSLRSLAEVNGENNADTPKNNRRNLARFSFFYYFCTIESKLKTIYIKTQNMKVNVTHPSFISFLESISANILSTIKIDEYFGLSPEKKLNVSFTVLNLIKNSAKVKANLSDCDLKRFIVVLCKKNEETENYEFAAVLNDITENFDRLTNLADPIKKPVRAKKTNKDINLPPSP